MRKAAGNSWGKSTKDQRQRHILKDLLCSHVQFCKQVQCISLMFVARLCSHVQSCKHVACSSAMLLTTLRFILALSGFPRAIWGLWRTPCSDHDTGQDGNTSRARWAPGRAVLGGEHYFSALWYSMSRGGMSHVSQGVTHVHRWVSIAPQGLAPRSIRCRLGCHSLLSTEVRFRALRASVLAWGCRGRTVEVELCSQASAFLASSVFQAEMPFPCPISITAPFSTRSSSGQPYSQKGPVEGASRHSSVR